MRCWSFPARASTTTTFSVSAACSATSNRRGITASSSGLKHAELADISNLTAANELRAKDDQRRLDSLGNRLWHSDASFREVPGALSMLFAHIVPPVGGETEFADLRAA